MIEPIVFTPDKGNNMTMYKLPQHPIRNARQFIVSTAFQFWKDDCQGTAAALSYQTLFAVVPLLTVMYSVLNSVKAFSGLGVRIQEFLFENVVPQNVAVVQEYLSNFSAQARSLSLFSVLFLVVTAFLMLFTIEREFNAIWRVQESRGGFQRFLMYWAVLTLGPVLVGLGFLISGYVLSVPIISGVTESMGILRFVPVILSASLFTLIYTAVPNCVVPFRHALTGGILVAIVFELAKSGFARIMAGSNFQVIYGAFAAVPLFLLWVFVSWNIILVGAEVVKGLGVFRAESETRLESPLIQLLLILEEFYYAHLKGEVITDANIRKLAGRVDVADWNDFKARLMALNLIKPVDRGGLILSRDLDEISVWGLYRQVPFDMPQTIGGDRGWEKLLAGRLKTLSEHGEEDLNISLEALYRNRQEENTQDG